MILNFTQPRMYTCQYVDEKGDVKSFKFCPGDNKIPNAEVKNLLKHPGVKDRIDLGILVEKKAMTEDLMSKAKEEVAKETKKSKEKEAKK